MPSKHTMANINGQNVKLSNLDKILFPEVGLSKADFIKYLVTVAPLMLDYVKNRPLTLIRYPDGVNGTKFYMKNKPKWTPDWIKTIKVEPTDDIDYITIDNPASLAWVGNLASLEIHSMQVKTGTLLKPDLFVFDLDPPDVSSFYKVKEIAFGLKSFLEGYGYYPFVKTSGSKGLHLCIPILPLYNHKRLISTVKNLAKAYIKINPECTLKLNKKSREGRLLLDIYRNHRSQTTVIPYSTRAKEGASISMPISWETLHNVKSAQEYTMQNAPDIISNRVDPWKDFYKFAVKLHDDISDINDVNSEPASLSKDVEIDEKGILLAKESLTDDKLETYDKKRDFSKTKEPKPKLKIGNNNLFVIQLHDATNLHYDLRIEEEGALTSWAIPKGLPLRSGVKRLAIQTEAHPVKYIDFEGTIPKDEYGGGEMWVYDSGTYELIEKKSNKYLIKLIGSRVKGLFSLYKTKDNLWLTERKDNYRIKRKLYKPMLAGVSKTLLTGHEYFYEIKWDGIRIIVYIEDHNVTIISRSGRDITKQFPEISKNVEICRVQNAVLDAELVCLDEVGRPLFHNVISRMHTGGLSSIERNAKKNPVYLYTFDLLELDGRDCTSLSQEKRRDWLETILKKSNHIRISEAMPNGKELFDATKAMGLEGIMVKLKNGNYHPGRRTNDWVKVKHRTEEEAYVIGYTKGKGDRVSVFGALHLAKKESDGKWKYMGKVGSGFNEDSLNKIFSQLKKLKTTTKPIPDTIEEIDRTIWIEEHFKCEIEYASLSSNGTYREPVFRRLIE